MDIVVVYDIAGTNEPEGAARLRQLSDICASWGQRVQCSVFECRVTQVGFVALQDAIKTTINPKLDSVLIYRMTGDLRDNKTSLGVQTDHTLGDPWVL